MYVKSENLNQALIQLSKKIVQGGIEVVRRGYKCKEIPGAVLIEIENPTDRYVRIPERKWNKTLGWIESLWLARGDNSLDMPASYVKNLNNFSDDGKFMRAGYGPRLRMYGNNYESMETVSGQFCWRQYKNGKGVDEGLIPPGSDDSVDQFRFVIDKFKEDINTREAVITIADPISDDYIVNDGEIQLLITRDTPCTRSIHFMVVEGKLNCYVDMRSNDLIWGFSAVNVFNFTLMQEYIASIIGIPVGKYYHKVDNLHVYEALYSMVEEIAKKDENMYPSGVRYEYATKFTSLEEFDELVAQLTRFEELCRSGNFNVKELRDIIKSFKDPMFRDWARVIFRYWTNQCVEFDNPLLNDLFFN